MQVLAGDWIVLYPDHQLRNQRQRDIYRKLQDSIVGEAGLKLIRLKENGQFQQMDSLVSQGSWELEENNELIISNGGKGFNYLKATFKDYTKKELEIVENVAAENEMIRLVWHWKKIEGNDAGTGLFDEDDNNWRIRPGERNRMSRSRRDCKPCYFTIHNTIRLYQLRLVILLEIVYCYHSGFTKMR